MSEMSMLGAFFQLTDALRCNHLHPEDFVLQVKSGADKKSMRVLVALLAHEVQTLAPLMGVESEKRRKGPDSVCGLELRE